MIKLSVIIPMYNAEKYIEKCICSVLNQTLKNIEVIVINDGCSDNSLEIVKSIKDKRIILINNENQGVSKSRNMGLELARGEYVIFIDSDDYITGISHFENMYNQIKESKSNILSGNARLFFEEENKYVDMNKNLAYKVNKTMSIDEFILKSIDCDISPICLYLYNRKFLMDNNLKFEDRYHEDELFVYQALTKCEYIDVYDNSFYAYRQRMNSRNNMKLTKMGEDIIQTCLDLEEDFSKVRNINTRKILFNRSFNMILENILKHNIKNINLATKKYLIRNSNSIKEKIRAYICLLSPKIYTIIVNKLITK